MNLKHIIIAFFALTLVVSSFAFAGHHYHGHGFMMPSGNMNELDTDQNGTLSFDEYLDSYRKQLRAGFDMIDSNNNGEIDAEEWRAFLEVHGIKAE
jgi:hypothetical protein